MGLKFIGDKPDLLLLQFITFIKNYHQKCIDYIK